MVKHRPIRPGSPPPAKLSWGDRVVLCLMFLLPVPSFLGEAAARSADAVRFGSLSSVLFTRQGYARGWHVRAIAAILVLMFLFACASLICGESHSLRDLLDVLRIAAFGAVFLFGASLCWRGRGSAEAALCFSRFLLTIGALNALFTLAQYTFPETTRPIQALYATDERHIDLLSEQGRAFGFFANPNTNAVMLLLLSLPGLVVFQLTGQTRYLLLGIFVFASVLLTASRTGIVLAAVIVTVLCIASRKLSYLIALSAIAWISYQALTFLVDTDIVRDWFPYLSELLTKIHGALHGDQFDVNSIQSFHARIAIWDDALEWFHTHPILGAGPLRDVIPSFSDNYYIYLLSRYGIAGLGCYAAYSVYIAVLSVVAILTKTRPHREWGLLTLASVVTVNVANYTIDAFPIVPIAMLTLLYAGYMSCLSELPRASRQRSLVSLARVKQFAASPHN